MKKIISLLAVAILAVVCLSSCEKDSYGNHSFFCVKKTNAAQWSAIDAIVAKDPYFATVVTKKGNFNQVCPEAIEEFKTHCRNLDAEAIEALLKGEEVYKIEFWSMDPAQNWISYVFRSSFYTIE